MTPPTVDPAGAQAVWSNLVGLLRPAWRRAIVGQPHVAFEYAFDRDGVQLRLWVPGPVPPGLVERASTTRCGRCPTSCNPARDRLSLVYSARTRAEKEALARTLKGSDSIVVEDDSAGAVTSTPVR